MTFLCRHFNELSLVQLYALMALRQEIFVVEQDCPYLDADGKDQHAYHLMGFDDSGTMVAYARLLAKGVSYPEYSSIGRVVTAKHLRGKGFGKILMEESIHRCQQLYESESIKISAQVYAQSFYQNLGFESFGEAYLEDDIPHIGMLKKFN